jgi:hypothetical protein
MLTLRYPAQDGQDPPGPVLLPDEALAAVPSAERAPLPGGAS